MMKIYVYLKKISTKNNFGMNKLINDKRMNVI